LKIERENEHFLKPSPLSTFNQLTMVQLTIDNAKERRRSKTTFRSVNVQRPKTKGPRPARVFQMFAVFTAFSLFAAFTMFPMFPRTRDTRKKQNKTKCGIWNAHFGLAIPRGTERFTYFSRFRRFISFIRFNRFRNAQSAFGNETVEISNSRFQIPNRGS